MQAADFFAVGSMLLVYVLISVLVLRSGLALKVKFIVAAGVLLRIIGAFGREAIAADANVYFRWGVEYAAYFTRLDFSPLYEPSLWRSSSWIGTNFVGYPAGLAVALVGENRMAVFLLFALLSLLGVAAYALAFRRAFPEANYMGYFAWIFLIPSLWFWPASIGKEALMMVGLGVATLGFVGRRGTENWPLMGAGLLLAGIIRPEVAAVFLLAMVLSHFLRFRHWSPGKVLQSAAIFAVGLAGVWYAVTLAGVSVLEPESLEGFVRSNAALSVRGGSAIETLPTGWIGVPLAAVNVLFRPFVWEAHNVNSFVASLEVLLMWGLILWRRRQLWAALKAWRTDRTLRFAVPFLLIYTVALGLNLANLGIIARQRVLVFPILFLIIEAGAAVRVSRASEREAASWGDSLGPLEPALTPQRRLS